MSDGQHSRVQTRPTFDSHTRVLARENRRSGRHPMTKVALIGTGAMGSRVAARIMNAGHQVIVYNRTRERLAKLVSEGAEYVDSPRAAAERAEIVISMVTDDVAARAVWLAEQTGAVHGMQSGSVAVESSTVTPGWISTLTQALSPRGVELLDAPVIGSTPQADAGALIYVVGGSAEAYERAREVLSAGASSIYNMGPSGSGARIKLAINALFACQVVALSEVLHIIRRSGLPLERALPVLNAMPITSPAMQGIASQIASRSFAPFFPIDLVEKDLRYIVALAEATGITSTSAAAALALFRTAQKRGLGAQNISAVAQLFE